MTVLERWQDQALAVFRIVVGFLFAAHGAAALFGYSGMRTSRRSSGRVGGRRRSSWSAGCS